MSDYLPPNATPQERALSEAVGRIGDVPVLVSEVWNPYTCPASILPWLAWAFSVDSWDSGWNDQQKRDTIKASVAVHKTKGTIGAVKSAMAALGIDAVVQEWFNLTPVGDPYTFRLTLIVSQNPITQADIAKVLAVVDSAKNLRSHLEELGIAVTSPATVYIGAVPSLGTEITITAS